MGGGIDLKIFNGNKLDKKLKEKIQLEIGLDNKAFPVIGYCGRLNYEKGLNELIEAFKNVLEYFPHSQLLFIAIKTPGERDNFHGRLKKIINESELYNNVIITFREDIPNLLSLLDIFTFRGVSKELDSGKSTCGKLQSGRGIGKSVWLPEEIWKAYQTESYHVMKVI